MKIKSFIKYLSLGGVFSLLVACGGGGGGSSADSPVATPMTPAPVMMSYTVNVNNLTHNQPLSPLAVVMHSEQLQVWEIGMSASVGLETLAESGDPASLLAELPEADVYSSQPGSGIIAPGMSEEISLTFEEQAAVRFTVLTMMVNTNDAFAGVQQVDVSGLGVGESMTMNAPTYDAGTESNSETIDSIPGPAAGGEGFNATRDDVDYISRHPGVVTQADGYVASALDESHRFNDPGLRVTVTRTE